MNVDTTVEFWERVAKEGLTSEDQRLDLLLRMAQEGKIDNVMETGRSKEQIIQDYSKHYKTICDLTNLSDREGDDLP